MLCITYSLHRLVTEFLSFKKLPCATSWTNPRSRLRQLRKSATYAAARIVNRFIICNPPPSTHPPRQRVADKGSLQCTYQEDTDTHKKMYTTHKSRKPADPDIFIYWDRGVRIIRHHCTSVPQKALKNQSTELHRWFPRQDLKWKEVLIIKKRKEKDRDNKAEGVSTRHCRINSFHCLKFSSPLLLFLTCSAAVLLWGKTIWTKQNKNVMYQFPH